MGDGSLSCATVTAEIMLPLILLAQQEGREVSPLAGMLPFLPLIIILFLYIFIVQKPNSRREQETRRALEGLKRNDHVLTSSGIYGVVTNVQLDTDEITIRVDEATGAKLRVTKASIARILDRSGDDKEQKKDK